MGTKTGYLGPTNGYFGYEGGQQLIAPLQINTNGRLSYGQGYYPLSGGTILKMDEDEYPVSVSAPSYYNDGNGDYWENHFANQYTDTTTVVVSLCTYDNSTRANTKQIASFTIPNESTRKYTFSNSAISGGTVYANKKLYLYVDRGRAWLKGGWRFNFTTVYVAKTVTLNQATGGTISISNNSLARGETAVVTVTPNDGYTLNSLAVSAGTLTQLTASTYQYTMSSPGQAVTITPSFRAGVEAGVIITKSDMDKLKTSTAPNATSVTRYTTILATHGNTYGRSTVVAGDEITAAWYNG